MLNRGLNARLGWLIGAVCVVLDYSEKAVLFFSISCIIYEWLPCCSGFFFFKTNHCRTWHSGLVTERRRPTGHITLVNLQRVLFFICPLLIFTQFTCISAILGCSACYRNLASDLIIEEKAFYTDCQSQYSGWCFCFISSTERFFSPRWSSGSACILGQKCNLKAFDVKPKSDGCILIEACFYPNKYMLHCFTYYSVRFIRVQEIKSTCKKRRLTYPMLGLGKSPNF